MTGPLFGALLGPSLLAAALALCVRPYRAWVGAVGAVLSLGAVAAAWARAGRVLAGQVPTWGPGEVLRVDALSAVLALCVTFVAALAAWLGPGLGSNEGLGVVEIRRFRVFSSLFASTMLVAVTTNNVAIMWVAVEATTITSAVLIPLHVSKASVEDVEIHPDRLRRDRARVRGHGGRLLRFHEPGGRGG